MIVGCLGDIVFSVSKDIIKTIRNVSWQSSATIQAHKRHMDVDLPEFTGVSLDSFTFNIRLSKFLGVSDPTSDVSRLRMYQRNGIALSLVIGEKSYGRWLVSKYKITVEHYDKNGNIVTADISVDLTEYPEE